jgi:hypothetical protein
MLPSGAGRAREPNDPWAFTLDEDEQPPVAAGAGKSAFPVAGGGSGSGAAPSAFPPVGHGGTTPAPTLGSPRSRAPAQLREADVLHCRVAELKELCRQRSLPVSGARAPPTTATRQGAVPLCNLCAALACADGPRRACARAGTKAVLIARLTGGQAPPPKPRARPGKATHVPLFDDDDDDDDDGGGQRDDDDDDDDFEAPSRARGCVR